MLITKFEETILNSKTNKNLGFKSLALILLSSIFIVSGCSSTSGNAPEFSEDGLKLVKSSRNTAVYKKEGVDLSQFSRIVIAESTAAFKENWQRDYNRNQRVMSARITDAEIQKAQTDVALMMDELFKEEFRKLEGFDEEGNIVEGTLLLRPSIINLSVNAPDKQAATRSRTFTDSAGEATLFLEVYDAKNAKLLGRVIDRKEDRGTGFYTWTTSVSNRADVRRAIRSWATQLREHFESLK